MTDIALVLFDLNGVLYRYDRAARIAALSGVCGLPADTVRAAIWDSGFEDDGDAGGMDADTYLAGFGTRLGCALTEAAWLHTLHLSLTPIPESLALLARLKPKVRCAVLTNNNLLVLRHFADLYSEVAGAVGDGASVSAEFGLRKPDPAVYRRCLTRFGVAPAAALFVDDNAANVAGAQAAGLAGYEFTDAVGLESEFRKYGVVD